MELSWLLYVLPVLTFGAGAYFGSYLKKKGENLATHEDIQKLVDQVRAITQTTKEIEAKISSDVWDQQKRWELKREAVFEVARKMAATDDSLFTLHSVHAANKKLGMEEDPGRKAKLVEAYGDFSHACDHLNRSGILLDLTCESEVRRTIAGYTILCRRTASAIANGSPEEYDAAESEITKSFFGVIRAMRKEIGLSDWLPQPRTKDMAAGE